ncbi:MAG TPA: hypothetical protein PLJ42_10510 [Chitinophagales bacterium]|nr:hypothetical protein [Chitinophagales bacterium]HQW79854.1 hypothetical protein [Chitinophagales bacterium]
MTDKLQELKQRQKEWRDITVTQLSNTNNILITLASGLFVFCIGNAKTPTFHIEFSQSIDWLAATYWASIFLLGLSIAFGICVLLTRLYDFRISRHIALTRQRFYRAYEKNTNNNKKELPYDDLGDFSCIDRVSVLVQILFCKLPFFTSDEIKNITDQNKFDDKFKKLRVIADTLGTATWRWTKIQIGLFIMSGLMYLFYRLI